MSNLPDGVNEDMVTRAMGGCPECGHDIDECTCEEDENTYADWLWDSKYK